MAPTSPPGARQPAAPAPGEPDATFDRARLRELGSARRSVDDRMIAGVCAGLGRQLGIDPVLLRVVVALLGVFGGAGVVLYVAGWLLIPEEGTDTTIVGRHTGAAEEQVRAVGLVVTGLVLVAVVAGTGQLSPFHFPWPVLAVAAFWWFVVRPRRLARRAEVAGGSTTAQPTLEHRAADEPAVAEQTVAEPTTGQPTAEPADVSDEPVYHVGARTADTAATEPLGYQSYSRLGGGQATPDEVFDQFAGTPDRPTMVTAAPPQPPSEHSSLFALTVSVGLLVAAAVYAVDQLVTGMPWTTYALAELAVVGVGLVVGAWFGRSRLLVLLGLVLSAVLAVSPLVPNLSAGRFHEAPTSVAKLRGYQVGAGRIDIDLTRLRPGDRALKPVVVRLGAGEVVVTAPRSLNLALTASAFSGELDLLGRSTSGNRIADEISAASGRPAVRLVVKVGFGRVEVTRP